MMRSFVHISIVAVAAASNMVSVVTAFTASSSRVESRRSLLQKPQQAAGLATFSYGGSSSSSTALHMNLFDRFQRVAKANLNNVLQSLEDPEKIMTQALEDMQVRPSYCFGI
jgi:PspA/IM30 family